jgi:hypothetical protein
MVIKDFDNIGDPVCVIPVVNDIPLGLWVPFVNVNLFSILTMLFVAAIPVREFRADFICFFPDAGNILHCMFMTQWMLFPNS